MIFRTRWQNTSLESNSWRHRHREMKDKHSLTVREPTKKASATLVLWPLDCLGADTYEKRVAKNECAIVTGGAVAKPTVSKNA